MGRRQRQASQRVARPRVRKSFYRRRYFPTRCIALILFIIIVIPACFYMFGVSRWKTLRLSYCGDGHFFAFIGLKLERTLRQNHIRLQLSDTRPDIIIGSTGDTCQQYQDVPRITVLGENIQADRLEYLEELSKISTVVLHCVKTNATLSNFHYYPFWVTSFGERRVHTPLDLLKSKHLVKQAIQQKTKFCAFMYSHASPARDRLFKVLNSYRNVDILGPFPDMGQAHDRFVYNDSLTFYDLAVEHYKPYKFVIAGENSFGSGYITEKIVNSMLASAIPIYVGAPDIVDTFNPLSFVNANNMTDENLLDLIRLLNTNDKVYTQMLLQPWFVGNRLPGWFDDKNISSLLAPVIQAVRASMPG